MQVLQAGRHKLILLELESELVEKIIRQSGYACELRDNDRSIVADLTMEDRKAPLLLFDAADPANLGWFSRCQFYVDGQTGAVLQTPISIANQADRSGRPLPHAIRLQIAKELPAGYCLPGRQPVSEQLVYSVLANLLSALQQNGVGVCGGQIVKPLAGRTDGSANR
jgi:hypothetical protein